VKNSTATPAKTAAPASEVVAPKILCIFVSLLGFGLVKFWFLHQPHGSIFHSFHASYAVEFGVIYILERGYSVQMEKQKFVNEPEKN
jgi:hypothetical protein